MFSLSPPFAAQMSIESDCQSQLLANKAGCQTARRLQLDSFEGFDSLRRDNRMGNVDFRFYFFLTFVV